MENKSQSTVVSVIVTLNLPSAIQRREIAINMFRHKQIVSSITVIATCVITTTLSQTSFDCNGDWSCKTPNGEDGYCILHNFCKPFNGLVSQLTKSQALTEDVSNFLQKFMCGYSENQARICCPFAPIVLETIVDISSHPNINLLPQDCGPTTEIAPRIFGGKSASLFEFPWMALLAYSLGRGNIGFRCGGTIISDRYILTAAHCLTALKDLELIGVRIGEHDIRSLTDCEEGSRGKKICAPPLQNIEIEEIIPHPEYGSKSFAHDIGLIRLATPIDLSQENAKPICLPTEKSLRNMDLSLRMLTVTGWGVTFQRDQNPVLQKADIPVISEENCRKEYENKTIKITFNHICAGSKTSDACTGDSGGPLQGTDNFRGKSRYIQYGIISFGPAMCGNTESPGVYARVDSYLKWILDNMKP